MDFLIRLKFDFIHAIKRRLNYLLAFLGILIIQPFTFAQNGYSNSPRYTYLGNFEIKIETGINHLLIRGDNSLRFVSETNSKLEYIELIESSRNRNTRLRTFLGLGVSYRLNQRFSIGVMYQTGRNQRWDEIGSINTIKIIGANTITTQSSGNYVLNSTLNQSTLMTSLASNVFVAKRRNSNVLLNFSLSLGYTKLKEKIQVANDLLFLSMYSEGFQGTTETIGSIADEEVKVGNYSWSLSSGWSFEFRNAPNISIGYRFTRLGEVVLIDRPGSSSNLMQVYLFNDQDNSDTTETLSLVSTSSRLKLFTQNLTVSVNF